MFITFIGLINSRIINVFGGDPTGYTDLGAVTKGAPLLTIIGLLIIGILIAKKVKGAIFIGIITTTIIGIPFGITTFSGELSLNFSAISKHF